MSYSENALFVLKMSSLLLGIDQPNLGYSKDDQGRSTLIVTFMTPEAGFFVQGHGHI